MLNIIKKISKTYILKNNTASIIKLKMPYREGWAKAAKECHKNEDDKLLLDFKEDFD